MNFQAINGRIANRSRHATADYLCQGCSHTLLVFLDSLAAIKKLEDWSNLEVCASLNNRRRLFNPISLHADWAAMKMFLLFKDNNITSIDLLTALIKSSVDGFIVCPPEMM